MVVNSIGGWQRFHEKHVCFLVTRKWFLKILLTYTFIPLLLNSFDLPSSKIEKKIHTKALADVSRGAGIRVLLEATWRRRQ